LLNTLDDEYIVVAVAVGGDDIGDDQCYWRREVDAAEGFGIFQNGV